MSKWCIRETHNLNLYILVADGLSFVSFSPRFWPLYSMALSFEDVLAVWNGLMVYLGPEVLNSKANYQHECLREFLIRFRCYPSVADASEHLSDFLEVIQFLTVMQSMTFTHAMGGVPTRLCNWVSIDEKFVGAPETWEHLKDVILKDPAHFNRTVLISIREIKSLQSEAAPSATYVVDLLSRVEALLDGIQQGIHGSQLTK